ncbi:alpha carbonic anhydrase [Mycena belliarum]|uniref:Carbonic anhydrase n=1 Tax=Mycena belliarum TaxID=1033014 RepID=A0AAD6U2Q4_9AGAR|nr:alpha carbonic anhydrase [Mycena belliae]
MFYSTLALVLATSAISASANCIHGTTFFPRAEGKVEVSKFGYSGLQGPLNWAGLDAANSACRTSNVQSPIVLDDKVGKAKSAPKVAIETVEEAEFENLGTTLEVVVKGKTTFEGKDFELQQFHLHTPSEHRINDEYFPLEMHMVHQAADGSIAVIAIPFQLTEDGNTTELLTSVTENLDKVKVPGTATQTGKLDFKELAEAIQTNPLFLYSGSLTTPPCKEGLTFLVMEKPLALNVKTYNALKSVIKFNARYSQNTLGQTNLLSVATELAVQNDGCKQTMKGTKIEKITKEKAKNQCNHMCMQQKRNSLYNHFE